MCWLLAGEKSHIIHFLEYQAIATKNGRQANEHNNNEDAWRVPININKYIYKMNHENIQTIGSFGPGNKPFRKNKQHIWVWWNFMTLS